MGDPEDIVTTLEGAVDRLKVLAKEREGVPLNDDVQEVFHLCETVESVLRHQQKERVNFWGERRDYWHYLTEGLSNMKELDSCVKVVQALPQLTTAQGKGRALIRECLSEQLLADCVQHSVSNSKRTKEWYHASAVLLEPSFTQRILSALYDLSEVTFDLPLEGVELDEHWPSFALKSFNSPVRPTSESKGKSSLFGVLGSTKEAKAAGKGKAVRRPLLERAVEEHPTEIFVKHEVPFDIELVGSLLASIRSNLIGQDFGQSPTHPAPKNAMLPELQVSKLDDITSCLTVLSDYITSWSHDVAKDSRTMKCELRDLKDKVDDLELQLQETIIESETSECSLLERISNSNTNLKSCNSVRHRLIEENESLKEQLAKTRSHVSELEMMNFDLEEQLVRTSDISSSEAEAKQRAYTEMEFNLGEKEKEVEYLTSQLEQSHSELETLRAQLAESQTQLKAKATVEELHQRSESQLKEKTYELDKLLEKQSQLESQNADLADKNRQLNVALEELKAETDLEIERLKRSLELETEQRHILELERDQARKDISSMQGQIELETSSLRFQMSSQTLEVQTAKETVKNRDKIIAELRGQIAEMEDKVAGANERERTAGGKVEEMRREIREMEAVLQSNQDEMTALHEQLTESNASRDNQRAEMLKLQNMADNFQLELKRQVDHLTAENDDIRKAFKKLLEQKVTLWQHADELEQEQVSMGTWIDSKDVTDCMGCGTTFSAFKRKHHCRSCGKVFCSKCCEQKAQLPVSKDPVRVCDKCHEKIEHVRTPYAAKVINSLDMDTLSQTIGLMVPSGRNSRSSSRGGSREGEFEVLFNGGSKNSLNIGRRSVDLSGNSLQAKLMLQNSDECSASSTPNLSRLEATLLSHDEDLSRAEGARGATFSLDYDAESIRSVSSNDYSVDPEVKQREAVKEQLLLQDVGEDMSVRISTIEGATMDDSYYVIETNPETSFPVGLDTHGTQHLDVDALASKLASIEVARKSEGDEVSPGTDSPQDPLFSFGSPLCNASRISQPSTSDADNIEYKEVMMEGGGVHTVPITIAKCGTAIAWEFNTEPKGIAFGITYKPSAESPQEDELLPLKRCSSHKAVLTGEYIAQKAGIYILKFDNRHSKYSGRKLMYKIWLKHSP